MARYIVVELPVVVLYGFGGSENEREFVLGVPPFTTPPPHAKTVKSSPDASECIAHAVLLNTTAYANHRPFEYIVIDSFDPPAIVPFPVNVG